jgi:signal recognition particle subunit SEC65
MSNTNEIVALESPRGNIEVAQAACSFIPAREAELLEKIGQIEVTEENYKSDEVAEAVKELADAVEDIREQGKKLVERVCAETEAQRIITQIDSRLWSYSTKADSGCTYAKLSAALKEVKAKIAEFKEANMPPAPTHTYIFAVTTTDKGLDKIVKCIEKEAKGGYQYCAPQSDKAMKAIQRFFDENK